MGLPLSVVELLLSEHQKHPLLGPVLSFGYPEIDAPLEAVVELLGRFGIQPRVFDDSIMRGRATVGVVEAFFGYLGLPFYVLDLADDREFATFRHDLNEPIPAGLAGRFGTVLDAGTLEHVFDVRQGFRNVADLLCTGGTAIHNNPMNNHVNHGFWQISPTAHFDFYEANGYIHTRAYCVTYSSAYDYVSKPFGIFPYDPEMHGGLNSLLNGPESMLATIFFAVKTSTSTSDRAPIQSFFRTIDPLNERRRPRFFVDYVHQQLRPLS